MNRTWASSDKRPILGVDRLPSKKNRSCPENRRSKLKPSRSVRETNDEVHGTIRFCQIGWAIIDSPYMQRLRGLKQLGTTEKVYMNTGHSRFEHSLGVAHLASKVCSQITHNQPELPCTKKDQLCVQLGALLHDVGHSIFSHVYEKFVNETLPEHLKSLPPDIQALYDNPDYPSLPQDFSHESVSLRLVDAVLEHLGLEIDLHNLDAPLKEIGNHGFEATSIKSYASGDEILTSRDFVFVKEVIWGKPIPDIEKVVGMKGFVGRPEPTKEWMYSVVCNADSGLDVDKMDYYARDSRRSNVGTDRVDEVIIRNMAVAWGECTKEVGSCPICRQDDGRPGHGHLMICFPEKLVMTVFNFFRKRYDMHSAVYQHPQVNGQAHLICDILAEADPFFRLKAIPPKSLNQDPTKCGRVVHSVPISRAAMDNVAVLGLVDALIQQIYNSTDKDLQKASELADRYLHRIPYFCALNYQINRNSKLEVDMFQLSKKDITNQLLELLTEVQLERGVSELVEDDIVVEKTKIHYGKKDQNPMKAIRVVKKAQLDMLHNCPLQLPFAERINLPKHEAEMPQRFQKWILRLYCRDQSKSAILKSVAERWIVEKVMEPASSVIEEEKVDAIHEAFSFNSESGTPSEHHESYSAIVSQSPIQSNEYGLHDYDSFPATMPDL